jgi:hypothetical protein
MPSLTSVALGQNEDGRLELVATSRDDGDPDTVWHAWQVTPSGDWSGWRRFGKPGAGDLFAAPAIVQHTLDGRLAVLVIGGDDAVWHRGQTAKNNGWSDLRSLGKPGGEAAATRSPAVARRDDGRLAAVVTAGGAVWQTRQRDRMTMDWESWSSLGRPGSGQAGDLALVTNPDGRLLLFTPELDHDFAARGLWYRHQTAPGSVEWSGWKPLGKPGGQRQPGLPVVARSGDGRLVLLTVASDGTVWQRSQQSAGAVDSWTPWASLGQGDEEIWEIAVAMDATARLVMVATTQSNRLWHTAQTDDSDNGWAPWKLLSTLPVPLADPTDPTLGNPTMRLNSDGRMEAFVMTGEGRPYQLRAPAAGDWGKPLGRLWTHP